MSGPSEQDVQALLDAAWERNHERVLARLDVVVEALGVLAATGVSSEEARNEAHVLSGALGTYGRPGSRLLREAELAFAGRGEEAAALADEVARLREQLA